MSKNFVREIDGIRNINKQEFYTNKANDLLSTKEHNYIRKQKQEYHCLTDNVKSTNAENVTYNSTRLITVDNSKVPTTNQNTISASGLVNALNEKDRQIKELKDKIDKINPENKPALHYVAEFAGNQFFNMQTTQTYNFSSVEIFTRVAYRFTVPTDSDFRNFSGVLLSGATNFDFNDYNISIANVYGISGNNELTVAIDSDGTGLDFMPNTHALDYVSGEIFIKFKLAKNHN